MNRKTNYGLYALAVAIAVVGALWLGVPAGTLTALGLVLICPLMMLFMMRAMQNGGEPHEKDAAAHRDEPHDHTTAR